MSTKPCPSFVFDEESKPMTEALRKSALLREALLEQMRSGRLKAGDRLPAERLLGKQFGLGRNTVRRVLGELKDLALISQVMGSGTYVSNRASAALAALAADCPAALTSPVDLMDARLALEPAIMAMVVNRATPADLQRMRDCFERAESARSVAEFERWDGMLHETIADATHNPFVSSVFRLMSHVRARGAWAALKIRTTTDERRQQYQEEHRELIDALMSRDIPRAERATLAHLQHIRFILRG